MLDLAAAHTQECLAAATGKDAGFGIGNFKRPLVCETLAVHPDQIEEARTEAKKRGVAVPHFDEHGRPHFHSNLEMRRYARAHGFRHKGYYG